MTLATLSSKDRNIRKKIYIAGPLFSEAERTYNEMVAGALDGTYDVYLPQRDGQLLVELTVRGIEPDLAKRQIFAADVKAIRACSALIIILDGRSVDEGAAFELGLAFALGKLCIGLQTDPRRLLPVGNNPMIEVPLATICRSLDDLLFVLSELTHERVGYIGNT